eukprot:3473795-Amphidinium_carterae.1
MQMCSSESSSKQSFDKPLHNKSFLGELQKRARVTPINFCGIHHAIILAEIGSAEAAYGKLVSGALQHVTFMRAPQLQGTSVQAHIVQQKELY